MAQSSTSYKTDSKQVTLHLFHLSRSPTYVTYKPKFIKIDQILTEIYAIKKPVFSCFIIIIIFFFLITNNVSKYLLDRAKILHAPSL